MMLNGSGYGAGNGGSAYSGGFRTHGDVDTRYSANPTAIEALESAVALPGVYTRHELQRTLRRHHHDVMKAALQLREKHAFRKQFHYDELNIGMQTVQIELKKGYVHLLENACDPQNCPILLLLLKHFKPCFSMDKMQLKGKGTMDGTSSLEDTRRLSVYMMDLAVEVMEENKAEGIVFIVDLDGCSLANLEAKMVTDLLQVMKNWYPEVVKHVLMINGTTFTRGITHLLTKLASERTQQRIRILQHTAELRNFLHPPAIPQMYGGTYRLMTPIEWMKLQAEIEEVDLDSKAIAHEEKKYMTKDARQLNGMQYAACSVDQVVEMKTSVIRGPIYRNKSGVAWVKMYGILRPEALLLYEQVTSKMPQIIIPVNEEVSAAPASFADAPRGTFGFRMEVPGVAGGHLLAACSEHERGNWLQEIQMGINEIKQEIARERYEEEERLKEERRFAALNMISFDNPESPQKQMAPTQQQQPVMQFQSQTQFQQQPSQQQFLPSTSTTMGSNAPGFFNSAAGQMSGNPCNMTNPMTQPPPVPVNNSMMGFQGKEAMRNQVNYGASMMMGMPQIPQQQQQQHQVRPPQPVNNPTGMQMNNMPMSMMSMNAMAMGQQDRMMNPGGVLPMGFNPLMQQQYALSQQQQQQQQTYPQQYQMNQQFYNPTMQNFRG